MRGRRAPGAVALLVLLTACGGGATGSSGSMELTGTPLDPPAQVMATLAGTLARLDEDELDRLDVVFVTTDPARDDEAVVDDYVGAFDPSIIGLTGDLDDIVEVGKSLYVGVDQGEKLPSGGYDITHGTRVMAIDADDQSPVMWDHDVSQAQLAGDVLMLLDEG